jgi:hypothetical protein
MVNELKKVLILFFLIQAVLFSQPQFSSINSAVGTFSRMGFGPRGMAMGNSISAVKEGNLVAYYNPASSVFQDDNSFNASYSFLSLDRKLNFVSFTRRFDFYSKKDTAIDRKPASTAGISAGVINSGVGKIDARDSHGFKKDEISTAENQFFVAVAIRFSNKFAAGLNVKFYHYKLYEDISSNGLGFDVGMIYSFSDNFSCSFVITDINGKYRWDSTPIYEQEGTTTENKFPVGKKIGVAYRYPEWKILATAEVMFDNMESRILRAGIEYNLVDKLFLRGGIDNLSLNNPDEIIRPALGFSYFRDFASVTTGIDYAFVVEPYSSSDRHIVGINIRF